MKRYSSYLVLPLVFVLLFSVSGCGKSTAERSVENAIERATNNQADVDVSTNTVTINTNGGSWQAGQNVSLPSGFPDDVYVIDGTLTSAITTTVGKAYTISMQTDSSVSEVKSTYDREIVNDGWTVTADANYSGTMTILAEKDKRTLTVGIATADAITTVTISTFTPDETNAAE
jgi:hypothetical protein